MWGSAREMSSTTVVSLIMKSKASDDKIERTKEKKSNSIITESAKCISYRYPEYDS